MHALYIIVLDTLGGDLVEIWSSSIDLSLFSSKVGSHPDEGAGAAPNGSSSVSVRELLPGIDQLDEVGPECAFIVAAQNRERDQALCSHAGS